MEGRQVCNFLTLNRAGIPMKKNFRNAGIFLAALFASGCLSTPIQRVDVQSFEARGRRPQPDRVHAELTTLLVERGFDIKNTDKDAGLLTTEYKKFASQGQDPPFDYFLQVRLTLRALPTGEVAVKMSPFVKEQNRLNAAASSEHELSYCEGKVNQIDSLRKDGWQTLGQLTFMNIVNDVSVKLGVAVEAVTKNVTRTPKNGFMAKSC